MHRPSTVIRPATYKDVLEAPSVMVAELIDGALHLHPRPAIPNVYAATRLGGALAPLCLDEGDGAPAGWLILNQPELHLGEDVLVPDLAGWRRERMPPFDKPWIEAVPDWVCEVVSPSTRRFDVTEKRDIYRSSGVEFLWLLDPDARTLEGFRLHDEGWLLITALHTDTEEHVQPFTAVRLPLRQLWAWNQT